jgi:FtsP/CotA-like multicopper oxidase with cupredoxin domain
VNPSFPLSRRYLLCESLAAGTALALGSRSRAGAAPDDTPELRIQAVGYGAASPGPALQVRRGEEVRVRVVNDLAQPTAVHWHGVRLVNAMDGAPPLTQAPIAPGKSFDYRFVAPDAGTFWYHPPRQTPFGLYGSLVVTEPETIDVDWDPTLIFDIGHPPPDAAGARTPNGAAFTVNGTPHLNIDAAANERLRLRLINASVEQILELRVEGLRTFVMATDSQPVQPFTARDSRLSLGPGNRIDVFVDCTLTPGASAPIFIDRIDGSFEIARIVCRSDAPGRAASRNDPPPLPANSLPERMDFAGAFRLDTTIGRTAALPLPPLPGTPLFGVKRARTVQLGISNSTSENRSIHLHGHSFRLLDALDDGWKPFWLDTLPIAPHSTVRIAFVADNLGKWLVEGLSSGDQNAWFEVT